MAHRILLVDDSPATRTFVEATLEEEDDLEIVEAKNGFEALKLLPRGEFDLLITDINMPDINGLELVRYARTSPRYQDAPVLVISTEGRQKDVDKAMALGANEYIVKPFTAETLLGVVRKHLGDSSQGE